MKVRYFILVMIMMLMTLQAASAASQGAENKQQAVEIAQQQFSGRVLSVKHQGDIYRVKILNSNGDVRIIKVKAINGNQSYGRQSGPDR
jgi:uncharacterized membrane protein YkoI